MENKIRMTLPYNIKGYHFKNQIDVNIEHLALTLGSESEQLNLGLYKQSCVASYSNDYSIEQ